jgi:hypothetical protein
LSTEFIAEVQSTEFYSAEWAPLQFAVFACIAGEAIKETAVAF